MLQAIPVGASETAIRLPDGVTTFADGRKPIEALYQSYLKLLEYGWTLEIVAESQPPGTSQALPIIALRSPRSGPAVWILAGIHGEEPAGPNALAAAIDDIARLGQQRAVVLLPLLNPQGYARNWRYLNTAIYSESIEGQSVGDSSHLLPAPGKPGSPRAASASSPEAQAITAFVLRLAADYPPLYSIDLHEDNLIDQGYVYSQGSLGSSDPLAMEAVNVLKDNGAPIKLSGKTRFDEPVVGGIIGPVIDSSIDELISSKDVIVAGRAQPGPAARTVLVFETPAAALTLERRIDAHAALIRRLPALIASTGNAQAQAPSLPEYGIHLQEAWITLPDGVRLSADLYMPDGGAADAKFPVLLEYLPYRKHEARSRNYPLYSYFVQRGYVVAAVDIRGTGNSEGRLIPYEYSEVEQKDGETIIDWLSKQPWSNGNVGMFGISWGGFNSIQMAARHPPALKAIIAVDATEDLYQDDVHFMDGIMHVDSWEMSMDLDNTRPGAPDYRVDDANFRDRFDTEPWMLTYKVQQRDGPFWDRASVRGRYDEIRIPTFHIGGWYDGYRDSIARMLEHVKNAPVKAIMGAWHHTWPNEPYPGPGMEWRHEAVRWFDHWLKGEDTGILEEPRFAVFVRNWHPPGPKLEHAPGAWRYEDGWPLSRIRDQVLHPQANHTLAAETPAAATHQLRYLPSVGFEAGGPVMWWGDVAHDQRGTDAFSLVYDGDPLEADLEILGFPHAILMVAANATRANWIARLSDVAPDGTVTQVTGAAMNGAHRVSAREPKAIVPGEPFELDIEMHFTSWVFPKGHRIRLAINNAMWPMLWPTPEPMMTELKLGDSRLTLPVVPYEPRPVPDYLPPAEDPVYAGVESIEGGTTSGYGEISSVDRNPQTGTAVAKATNESGTRYPWGTERSFETIRYEINDKAPADAKVTGTHRMEVEVPGRKLVWDAVLSCTSDHENFHYSYLRRLSENGKLLREKTWTRAIPRDFQ